MLDNESGNNIALLTEFAEYLKQTWCYKYSVPQGLMRATIPAQESKKLMICFAVQAGDLAFVAGSVTASRSVVSVTTSDVYPTLRLNQSKVSVIPFIEHT
jgi:hypothetical protein